MRIMRIAKLKVLQAPWTVSMLTTSYYDNQKENFSTNRIYFESRSPHALPTTGMSLKRERGNSVAF